MEDDKDAPEAPKENTDKDDSSKETPAEDAAQDEGPTVEERGIPLSCGPGRFGS